MFSFLKKLFGKKEVVAVKPAPKKAVKKAPAKKAEKVVKKPAPKKAVKNAK